MNSKLNLYRTIKNLDDKFRYTLESVIDLECDEYVEEACEDIAEFSSYVEEMKDQTDKYGLKTSFCEKANSVISDKVNAILKYAGGTYNSHEYESVKHIISHKESLLKDFYESCLSFIESGRELPEFNARVMLESTSISETKKNDILTEYYEMDMDSRHIIDTHYEFVSYENSKTNELEKVELRKSMDDEERRVAVMKAKEKIAILSTLAIVVGTVIKVGDVLKLRKVLNDFGKMYGFEPLSTFDKEVYDEDEIPKSLRKELVWNDVNYNYKMEVYLDSKGKLVCGRVYAYTCSPAKIKLTLLSQPRSGSVAKVNYFVSGNNEFKTNYYMMAMALDDRIAHESVKRVADHMKVIYKEEKEKKKK